MTLGKRFDLTINHRQPDRMVVDFGATPVTGINALPIEKLRKYYGLEYRPVRITDPFQMLGEVDQELMDIIGVDPIAARRKNSSFRFYKHSPLKEYMTSWGQLALVQISAKGMDPVHLKKNLRQRDCFLGWRHRYSKNSVLFNSC